jgi:hypothetical protein
MTFVRGTPFRRRIEPTYTGNMTISATHTGPLSRERSVNEVTK